MDALKQDQPLNTDEETKQEVKYKVDNDKLIITDLVIAKSLVSMITSVLGDISQRDFEKLEISFSINKISSEEFSTQTSHVLQKPKEEMIVTHLSVIDKLKNIH